MSNQTAHEMNRSKTRKPQFRPNPLPHKETGSISRFIGQFLGAESA